MDELCSLLRFLCPLPELLLQRRWVLPPRVPFAGKLRGGTRLGRGTQVHSRPAVLASGTRRGAAVGMPQAAGRAARALGNTMGQWFSSCKMGDRFSASERLENVSCLSPTPPPKPAGRARASCCLTALQHPGGTGAALGGRPVQLGAGAERTPCFTPALQL